MLTRQSTNLENSFVEREQRRNKMDGPSPQSGAQVSIARSRLKTLICAVAGILILLMLGASGYLAYDF